MKILTDITTERTISNGRSGLHFAGRNGNGKETVNHDLAFGLMLKRRAVTGFCDDDMCGEDRESLVGGPFIRYRFCGSVHKPFIFHAGGLY